jgi:hypothetical protein
MNAQLEDTVDGKSRGIIFRIKLSLSWEVIELQCFAARHRHSLNALSRNCCISDDHFAMPP